VTAEQNVENEPYARKQIENEYPKKTRGGIFALKEEDKKNEQKI
jgi:hypothetical protein